MRTSGSVGSPLAGRNSTIRPRYTSTGGGWVGGGVRSGHEEPDDEQQDEPADERDGVPAQALERDVRGFVRSADPRRIDGHVAGFDERWAASARSFRTRRCASTRLASEARPSRTRMPVQRSNGSNVAAWMTRVPPATGSSRQLHSLSKPDAVTRTRKRESGRASRLSTCAASRSSPSRARAERVVAAAGQGGAAGPRRSSGKSDGRRPPDRGASPTPCAAWRGRRRAARPARRRDARRSARLPCVPPPVPTAIVSRRSGARPSSSRGRRRSIRGVRRRRRRASRSGPRRPWSGGATGA